MNNSSEKNRDRDKWRWESNEVRQRPGKKEKGRQQGRQHLKDLIRHGQYDADELYEDE